MKNHIDLIDQFSGNRLVVHALDRVMKARVIFQMANVLKAAGRKIVNDKNFVAALQIRIGKMRANKACAASDQNSQIEKASKLVSGSRRKSSTIVALRR